MLVVRDAEALLPEDAGTPLLDPTVVPLTGDTPLAAGVVHTAPGGGGEGAAVRM